MLLHTRCAKKVSQRSVIARPMLYEEPDQFRGDLRGNLIQGSPDIVERSGIGLPHGSEFDESSNGYEIVATATNQSGSDAGGRKVMLAVIVSWAALLAVSAATFRLPTSRRATTPGNTSFCEEQQ